MYKMDPEKGVDFAFVAGFIELLRMHYKTLNAY
jgi:hypothetical protein